MSRSGRGWRGRRGPKVIPATQDLPSQRLAREQLLAACTGLVVDSDATNLTVVGSIADFVATALIDGKDEEAVCILAVAEACMASGDEHSRGLVAYGFLENLGNVVSHPDVPVDPAALYERLGPLCRQAWDQLDVFWQQVAEFYQHRPRTRPGTPGPPTREMYLRAKAMAPGTGAAGQELHLIMRRMMRSMPDGSFIGTPDCLAYEGITGVSPPAF